MDELRMSGGVVFLPARGEPVEPFERSSYASAHPELVEGHERTAVTVLASPPPSPQPALLLPHVHQLIHVQRAVDGLPSPGRPHHLYAFNRLRFTQPEV